MLHGFTSNSNPDMQGIVALTSPCTTHMPNLDSQNARPTTSALSPTDKIDVLFHEYEALYGLAQFRLTSLERRATLAWAALGAFLTGIGAMAPDAQRAFLVGVPLALFWLLRTTINHARSFEDALRRLDEIERRVNDLANDELLVFQSRHPSKGGAIGGRTGTETLLTVLMTGLAMLLACAYLFERHAEAPPEGVLIYRAFLIAIALSLLVQVWCLRSYRYDQARRRVRSRTIAWPRRRGGGGRRTR